MRIIALALVALFMVACASESPASCELGRTLACACPGGGQGAQECGLSGVWSVCVCPTTDGGPDVADAASDAPPEATTDALTPDAPSTPDGSPDGAAEAAVDVVTPDAVTPTDGGADVADATGDGAACGGACAGLPHTTRAECTGENACSVWCADGYDDCDRSWSNGCETPLDTVMNCGGCGVRCFGARVCASGVCR